MATAKRDRSQYERNPRRRAADAARKRELRKDPVYAARNRAVVRAWNKKNPDLVRKHRREYWRRRQGTPIPAHPEPSKCECCGRASNSIRRYRNLVPDHCHETGLARGWICVKCNLALGLLGDTLEAAERAVAYLKRARIASGDLP